MLLAVSLVSCCWTSDSRVPEGYPFTGNSHELEYKVYGSFSREFGPWNPYIDSMNLVKDSVQYVHLFKKTPDIDLNIYNIAILRGYVRQVYEVEFQKRVLIDHKAKTCAVELRAYTKTCNSGLNSNYNNYYVTQYLLIPKVPEGYVFNIDTFSPVIEY